MHILYILYSLYILYRLYILYSLISCRALSTEVKMMYIE